MKETISKKTKTVNRTVLTETLADGKIRQTETIITIVDSIADLQEPIEKSEKRQPSLFENIFGPRHWP